MKNFKLPQSFLFGCLLMLGTSLSLQAQDDQPRPSLAASVTQTIGVDTKVTVNYSRPAVKGRKVWGDLVPYGLAPGNKYSNDKPYPWRAGANENTTIDLSGDVLVEGQNLKAGVYSIHMIPVEDGPWTVIFNSVTDAWGSYSYDESKDVLRVGVSPEKSQNEEYLTYDFENLNGNKATLDLSWEKLKLPITMEVASAN